MTSSPTTLPVRVDPPARPRAWGPGRVVAVIAAGLFLVLGTGLLAGGGVLRLGDGALRDDQGYLMGSARPWDSPGYAVRSEGLGLDTSATLFDLPGRLLGSLKATADPGGPDAVFIGLAHTADVDRYLRGVACSTHPDASRNGRRPMVPGDSFVSGGPPRAAPTAATFWEVSASGTGAQTITWRPRAGSWTLVVMNRAGTAPVSADVALGARVPALGRIGAVLMVAGLVVMALAGAGLWLAGGRR